MKKVILSAMVALATLAGMALIPSAQAKEPYATTEEWGKHVISKDSIPWTELVPGANTHLVWGDNIQVSLITMSPWSVFPNHTHEAEQIMIVVDGYMDELIEGKLYRVKKGDVIILPSNIPHGGYLYDVPCSAVDIFSPVRADYIEKTKKQGTYGVVIPK